MIRYLIIFFFIFNSCSKNDDLVDVEAFIEKGKKIKFYQKDNLKNNNISKINKLVVKKYLNYENWSEDQHNSQNFLLPSNIILDKPLKSLSGNFYNIKTYKDKIITIDFSTKISVYNSNLKLINSVRIYNKKIYKNYKIFFNFIIKNNKIYISDNLGNIHCFGLKKLNLIWKKKLSVPFMSSIKIYKDSIFAINSNSKIFSLNSIDGRLNWSFETASNQFKNKKSYQIAIFKNKLYFTNDHGEIYCLDLDKNNIVWSKNLQNKYQTKKPLIFESSPIVIDDKGNLYLSNNYGYTYSIDALNGEIKWKRVIEFTGNIFFLKDYIISHSNESLLIINKKNGNLVFNKKINFQESKQKILIKNMLMGKKKIYFFTNNDVTISINYNDIKKYNYNKTFKSFKNYSILKNNVYILTNSSIIKY